MSCSGFYLLVLLLMISTMQLCPTSLRCTRRPNPKPILRRWRYPHFCRPHLELGFYNHRYAAIWYYNTSYQQPVWVANKAKPAEEASGFLEIGDDGNLKVSGVGDEVVYWSTSISTNSSGGTSAKLLDSGHVILTDVDSGVILWQSLDSSPYAKSSAQRVSSWLVMNYLVFSSNGRNGMVECFLLLHREGEIDAVLAAFPSAEYSSYNDNKSLLCERFPGFKPILAVDSDPGNWSEGCSRTRLNCGMKNEFLPLQRLEVLFSSIDARIFSTESEEKCKESCLEDCTCNAYTHIGTTTSDEGITCQQWNLKLKRFS